MSGRFRQWFSRVLILVVVLVAAALSSCEVEDESCSSAKAHLCSKLQQQSCLTSRMGDAVARIQQECDTVEATRFVGAAESYCMSTTDYSAGTCSAL